MFIFYHVGKGWENHVTIFEGEKQKVDSDRFLLKINTEEVVECGRYPNKNGEEVSSCSLFQLLAL